MRNNIKPLLLVPAFIFLLASSALATNGHQLIGIGSYGMGMAGAVTAAPFDTTTAVTNPGGLTEIGRRADFHFEMFMPDRSVDFTAVGGEKSSGGSGSYLVPSIGWSAPINDDETLFFGGGMFVASGMGVDYDVINTANWQASSSAAGPMHNGRIFTQYQFWKMAPTLAKKFNDKLSIGISLNVDYQQMAFKQWFINNDTTTYPAPYLEAMGLDLSTPEGALGYGFTVGGIYDVSEKVSIGVTYISKQTFADLEYRLQRGDITYSVANADGTKSLYVNQPGKFKWSGMDFPQQYAIGVAIRPIDRLLVTADYKWVNFSDTYKQQSINGTYDTTNTTTGATGTASSFPLNFGWSDVSIYAIALQYQFDESGWIRIGYNHGDSPIKSDDVLNNLAFPAIVEDHLTIGGTKNIGQHWELHAAYMSATKKSLTENGAGMPAAKISLAETALVIGLSYKFQ